MSLTPGYDRQGCDKQKNTEKWIPESELYDGTKPTREEVLREAEKLGDTFGIQLMNDGKSFNIRFSAAKSEKGWMQLQQRQPPANKRYFVNIPRDDANDGIISSLEASLGWDAEIAGCARVRGNRFEAFNKVIVKANVAPIADTPLIGDFLVSINEDLPLTFESKPLRILGTFIVR